MGLTATDIELLLELRRKNSGCKRIATIGSLSLYLHSRQLKRLKSLLPGSRALEDYRWGDTADAFLKELTGATEVTSVDMSDYQGSTIVHDMNLPLARLRPDLAEQFDLVIDGGTLEHVFNFPITVSNLMSLLRKGGYFLTANPTNNLCGHGFYQFTPELMHRCYCRANGFRIVHVLLTKARHMSVEMDPSPVSYSVNYPMRLGRRVLLRNRLPVVIRALAEKVADQPTEGLTVQQSDYVAAWSGAKPARSRNGAKAALRAVFDRLPWPLQSHVMDVVSRNSLHNPAAMKRWRGQLE